MNKRIKELAKKSGLLGRRFMFGQYYDDELTDEHKRFAELIVRECTDIVDKRKDAAIDASWDVDEAMSNAVWDIEEHFYGDDE